MTTSTSDTNSIYQRLAALPWWGQCALIWLALAIGLSVAGWVGTRVLDLREGYDPVIELPHDAWPGLWARWDSPYYYNIAKDSYAAHPYAMGYFPLYPLTVAGLSSVSGLHLVTSGVVIAQFSYLIALLAFYRLARLIRDDHAFAMRAVIALALFPTSFFFLAMYAEALALALGILSLYFAFRGRWIESGALLGLAAAARPVGWLLGLNIAVEFLRRRQFNRRSLFAAVIGAALAVSGIVAYVLYLYGLTGTFTAIPRATALWLRAWNFPWMTLGKSIWIVFAGNGVPDDWFLYVSNLSDLLFTLFAITMTVLGIRRLPLSLNVYMIVSVLFLLSLQGLEVVPLWGMTRWVATLFPIYLVIADLDRRKIAYRVAMCLSALAMLGLMAWWASGRWVG